MPISCDTWQPQAPPLSDITTTLQAFFLLKLISMATVKPVGGRGRRLPTTSGPLGQKHLPSGGVYQEEREEQMDNLKWTGVGVNLRYLSTCRSWQYQLTAIANDQNAAEKNSKWLRCSVRSGQFGRWLMIQSSLAWGIIHDSEIKQKPKMLHEVCSKFLKLDTFYFSC